MKLLGKIEQAQDAVSKEYVDGLVKPGGGGGDTEELEEVSAGALCELNTRVKAQYEATQQCVKKNDFESYVEKNSEQTQNSEVIVVSALIDLNKRINELFDRLNRIESR